MKTKYFSIRKSVPAILLAFTLSCISTAANATIFYISTTGNDITGTGSKANPWKTLFKAASTVAAAGDIIHVNAGTYTETQQCNLAVGVSIEGDGATSIIKSSLTADWTAIIVATSNTEATNGNQHISNLYFDGQVAGTTGGTAWCIVMRGRKNFSIHDCTFVNFRQSACIFAGRTDNAGAAPTTFPTGNSFYNNTVNNCAEYRGAGQGCLMIGGQEGMHIYNNTISQTSRPIGYNGWPIKYFNDGFLNGCKIYNNILNKNPLGGNLGGSDWDFAIELFRESGLEIYGNTITGGGIDLNYQSKGNYAYSAWIHDNNIKMTTLNTYLEHAITLEFESKDVIVENNTMDKFNTGIRFVPRNTDTVKNIIIRRNLITNGGFGESTGYHINFGGGAQTNYYNNIDVYNNTMIMDYGNRTWFGIQLPDVTAGFIKNLHFKNNIIANSLSAGIIQAGGTVSIDSLNIDNNNIYNNGNNNSPVWNGPAPTHFTYLNNLNTIPTFNANYTLPAGSPLIDAGVYVGLPYAGTAPDRGYAEAGAILPITLLELNVTTNNGKNILQWKTASEINSDHFTIERSANGINFESIGSVGAAGYSSTEISYSFTDVNPVTGINYYRLVMVDKDKSKEISNVVSVNTKKNSSASITSVQLSAGKNTLSVAVNADKNEKAILILFDANGRVFLTSPVTLQAGLNRLDKSTATIAKGIYYVKLATAADAVVRNVMATE